MGTVNEAKRVARAVARRTGSGMLPDELLRQWADTGTMTYARRRGIARVELSPSDRIACARACATFYKAPFQSRPAPGEQPPSVRVELDERLLATLAKSQPDKLEIFRDVLRAIQAGGGDLAGLAAGMAQDGRADPSRYARLLAESPAAGRA